MDREISVKDANKFIEYALLVAPELTKQLKNITLIDWAIILFRPARLNDKVYEKYEQLKTN